MKIHKLTLTASLVAIGTERASYLYTGRHFQMLSRAACHQRAGSGDFRPRLCDSSGLCHFLRNMFGTGSLLAFPGSMIRAVWPDFAIAGSALSKRLWPARSLAPVF